MFIPIEGHHLVSIEFGAGMPLLLHDGWVASSALWLPLIERLHRSWRCIAYDQRGSGSSTFPPETITADAVVEDVFRVLDAHGVDRALLIGESLGSLICLQAALRDPARAVGLVLVGGFPRALTGPTQPENVEAIRADWPSYVERFVSACMPEPDVAHMHRFGCNTVLPAGSEAGIRMSAAHLGIAPDLEAITVPTLIIHGTLDVISPVAGAHELVARLPNAELVLIDAAGHVPILTRPDAVADAIDDWWARHRPA